MGDIKRQINSITDLKRGSVNVNFVYRAAALVWQRGAPVAKQWSIETWSFVSGIGPYSVIPNITTWDFTNGIGPTQKKY